MKSKKINALIWILTKLAQLNEILFYAIGKDPMQLDFLKRATNSLFTNK